MKRESLKQMRAANRAAEELLKSGSAPLMSPRRMAELLGKLPVIQPPPKKPSR